MTQTTTVDVRTEVRTPCCGKKVAEWLNGEAAFRCKACGSVVIIDSK